MYWENDFLWTIFLVTLYLFIGRNKPDSSKSGKISEEIYIKEKGNESETFDWLGKFLYLSNGQQIPAPHLVYYTITLKLENELPLTHYKIEEAFYNRLNEGAEQQKKDNVMTDIFELKAARDYLNDRYQLAGYLN